MELVHELENLGVRIWEEGGELRFRAPQGVMTAARRDAVRTRRQEVIEHLRQQAEGAAIEPKPAQRHEPFPLTDVQSAYLLGRQEAFAYGGVGCQVYGELRMASLDPARLEQAWNRLIARHDMLRATVQEDGYQQVMPQAPHYAIPVRDLRGQAASQAGQALEALRDRMAQHSFSAGQWPLFELAVTQGAGEARLHLAIDFLIADYMSVQRLLSELAGLYRDPAADLPPLTLSFRDYVLAERRQRASGRYARDRAYWMARIADLPPAPDLPLAPQAEAAARRFRRLSATLDRASWAAFRAGAARHDLTPSVAVLSAFAAILGRWSRAERFSLNLTLLNRQPLHAEVGALVGDFTTVSLLAVDQSGAPGLQASGKAIQTQLWQDMDHRLFSGVEVLREVARQRGQGAALMPVVFTSTIGLNESSAELGELVCGLSQTPQVWIDCQAIEREDMLILHWDIRDGVLPDGVPEAMFGSMDALLRRLAAGDAGAWTAADAVHLPPPQQAARQAANDTAAPLPGGLLHDGFFAQAAARPDRVAVVDGEAVLSYGALAAAARGIAHALREAGCEAGERVAVALDKGWRQVAAVLGIHLAGAAYLPLDTRQPALRRDRILHDAGVRLVLAQGGGDWPEGIRRLDPAAIPGTDSHGTWPAQAPDSLAYVIYTSGSTGEPKGVMIAHRAALNTIADINRRLALTPEDKVFGLAGLGFDLSVYDIFGPLGIGAALVLPQGERRDDPAHWCDVIAAEGVTVWNSVPAQMQMLQHVLAADAGRTLPGLTRAMLSGDWIPPGLPALLRASLPQTSLFSLGGATEASIWSIAHPIGEALPGWPSIPYGTPLANQSFHVLDRALRPCPDWVAGELFIGGHGLALGYLGDPVRTAERFIHHPATGERLYRTGDLGRYRPGGLIEFLGREDFQVKIRGYRIELAEIEAALQANPDVAAAAVLVDGEDPMDRRLAGFVQPGPAAATPAPLQSAEPAGDQAARARYVAFSRALDAVARLEFLRALQASGSLPAQGEWGDAAAIQHAARVAPRNARLLRRWLDVLVAAGLLQRDAAGHHACPGLPGDAAVAAAWAEAERLRAADGWRGTLQHYLGIAAREMGALLRNEVAATELFFPEGRTEFVQAAYEESLVGQYVNAAVIDLVRQVGPSGDGPLRVLEIGAGVGGTSAALIPALADRNVDYLFTDISRFFLNRAAEVFADHPFVRYGTLDINGDLRKQGYRPNSVDVIVACNVLHNAQDLGHMLRDVGALLRPGGRLVMVETVEEIAWTMASMEFMVGDEDYADRDATFLDDAGWARALEAAAGEAPLSLPPSGNPLHALGQRVLAVRFKTDRAAIHPASLQAHLATRLPPYMLPQQVEVVDALPLTANGKLDRKTMRAWLRREADRTAAGATAPQDELERRLAQLWASVLGLEAVGRSDNFFQIGGDSLLISQLTSRLHAGFPEAKALLFSQTMRQILHRPTIAELAAFLRQAQPLSEAELAEAAPAPPLTPLGGGEDGPACVLVHELGGTMAPYVHLKRELEGRMPLFGLAVTKVAVYLAREPEGMVEALADEYAALLAPRPPARLVGYGLGGLLATAIAGRLAERGLPPPALTLIGSCGTSCAVEDELALEYAFCRFIGADPARAGYPAREAALRAALRQAAAGGRIPSGTMAALDDPAIAALLALAPEQRLQRIAGAMAAERQDIDALDYARAHLSLFRQSLAAYARFRPGLHAGDIRLLLPQEETPALPWLDSDTAGFWRGLCLGEVSVERVPGNHFDCLKPPHVAPLARHLLALAPA
jgi:pyochelin synthetase